MKLPGYWNNGANEITNDSGLSIVPGGWYWHGNVQTADLTGRDGKAAFWTTTAGSESSKAYMVEVFDWRQDIAPWDYEARPWVEGDSTASRMVNVRCVRDMD